METVINAFLNAVRFFNSETSLEMFGAELRWFFGGLLFAWLLCAFGLVIRSVKAGAGHVDV